jgi:uracil-DNA glycosylase
MSDDDFFTFYEKYRTTTQLKCQKSSACKFPDCGWKIVWIPPPKKGELRGVIISRDPTTGFIEVYDKASKKNDDDCRTELMSHKGVPVKTIIDRIEKVCQSEGKKFSRGNLSNFLLNNCYWTHLLKCYTYSGQKKVRDIKSKSFKQAYSDDCVDCCSKKWLYQELNLIFKLSDVEVIILLGADVTKFVYRLLFEEDGENWRESKKYLNYSLIPLPHPSRANGASWTQPINNSLLENIEKINKLCDESRILKD